MKWQRRSGDAVVEDLLGAGEQGSEGRNAARVRGLKARIYAAAD